MSRSRFAPLSGLAWPRWVLLAAASTVVITALASGAMQLRRATVAFNCAANARAGDEVYVSVHSLALLSTPAANTGTTKPPSELTRGVDMDGPSSREARCDVGACEAECGRRRPDSSQRIRSVTASRAVAATDAGS